MNITGTVIGILIMAFLVVFAIFSAKETIKAKKELKEFEKKADEAQANAEKLKEHNEKAAEIKEERTEQVKEIKDAKTKEEIIALANSISDSNNELVRKQKEGRESKGTSSKTGKARTSKTNRK